MLAWLRWVGMWRARGKGAEFGEPESELRKGGPGWSLSPSSPVAGLCFGLCLSRLSLLRLAAP